MTLPSLPIIISATLRHDDPLPSHPKYNCITVFSYVKYISEDMNAKPLLGQCSDLVAKIRGRNISFRNKASDLLRKQLNIPFTLDHDIHLEEIQTQSTKKIIVQGKNELIDRVADFFQKLVVEANGLTVHANLVVEKLIMVSKSEFDELRSKHKEQGKFVMPHEIFHKDYNQPDTGKWWFCKFMSKVKSMCILGPKLSVKGEKNVVMNGEKKENYVRDVTEFSCCVCPGFSCASYKSVSIVHSRA